ncbi:MAG: hypothetical protein KC615_04845 [Anaerolineae bacterium]|nr:hypothetical protein [Anaerolineae bacterium]
MVGKTKRFLSRSPRIQPELPVDTVSIPPPPKIDAKSMPWWQAALPVITIIGYVLVSAFGRSGSNITFLIPMGLAVVASTGVAIYNALAGRQELERKRKEYAIRLVNMRRDMVNAHKRQRNFYEYNYPGTDVILDMRGDQNAVRGGTRLWERRASDTDFGWVRVGIGTRHSTVQYVMKEAGENDENPQARDAERLQADSIYLADVPITLPLYLQASQNQTPEEAESQRIFTNIGVALGPAPVDKRDAYDFIYGLLAHFSAFHSPIDTELYVVGTGEAASHWQWVYSLPHTQIRPDRAQYRIYFEDTEIIYAPADGILTEVLVQSKQLINSGDTVAQLRKADGSIVPIVSDVLGYISYIAPVNETVKAGQLIVRLDAFDLSKQQERDEILRTDHRKRGKELSRDTAGVPRFWKDQVWKELDRRSRRLRDRDENSVVNIKLPFMLIVVDMLSLGQGNGQEENPISWLNDVETEAALSLILSEGQQLGVSILFLTPDRALVPSGCDAVIELTRDFEGVTRFLYAETGLNTTRYVGIADVVRDHQKLQQFAASLDQWQIRREYGADIPTGVGLLNLYNRNEPAPTITSLEIEGKWKQSQDPEWADWPKVPLGMLAGQEVRDLHFFADADGVHGMIAGSTGSGKSELLISLVLSLAIKYDPSVVNFVLIDFKGGAAFDPLINLPHVVDIVTNLRGNAVDRMFAAINAELNRRQKINQDTDVKDIVRYRKRGLHRERKDNYPHLFIIVDEFAEMIASKPEYKAQLDSITRLGRALGVSLILAAQRPSGVTDQMRANIKFRICLRVETKEESSELLRLPDAAYLPSVPGRGYLQVGSESLQMIQSAYTGMSYSDALDYDLLERYEEQPIVWDIDLDRPENELVFEVLVRRMKTFADTIYGKRTQDSIGGGGGNRPWRKPWPSPLPELLALDDANAIEKEYLDSYDVTYINQQLNDGDPFVLSPAVNRWMAGDVGWPGVDWDEYALSAVIGLIDNPYMAKLNLLKFDFTKGHHLILGASGWGKSTVLRTLLTSLVTTHAPDELHLYMMDFGNLSLKPFETLPHTGAYVLDRESERVERLLRFLEQEISERKHRLSSAGYDNLFRYNEAQLDRTQLIPAILVVLDNYAQFRTEYEDNIDIFTTLVRDSQSAGVFFVITADQTTTVGKLFNLLPERITLRLADDGEYSGIVGRGANPVEEIPGRGLVRVERMPLELQVALPFMPITDELEVATEKESNKLLTLLELIRNAGEGYPEPTQIKELEERITLNSILDELTQEDKEAVRNQRPSIIVGRNDRDLLPMMLDMADRQHFIISGPPASGKTSTLQTIVRSLAEAYTPEEVAILFVDYQERMVDYGGRSRLDHLPHVIGPTIKDTEQIVELVEHLDYEYGEAIESRKKNRRDLFIIIDNYIDFRESLETDTKLAKKLSRITREGSRFGLHFILAGMRDNFSPPDELVRFIQSLRYGIALDVEAAESAPFYGNVPSSFSKMILPRGRGFRLLPGETRVVQIALPYNEESQSADNLDDFVSIISARYPTKAQWLELPSGEQQASGSANGEAGSTTGDTGNGRARPTAALTAQQRQCIAQKIADQMEIPVESLMASFEDGENDMGLIALAKEYDIDPDLCLAEE